MNSKLGLVAVTIAWGAVACGGNDDAANASAALMFHGEANPLGNYSYDTGMQPAGSPVQAQFKFGSQATLAVDAQAVATEDEQIASKPGSGKVALSAKFLLEGNLKIDVSGVKYDGPIPGLDAVDVTFGGEQVFDPFALETAATVDTSIPETQLPDIPLPGGLGGVLRLTITSESVLSSSFRGTCIASDGAKATYRGASVTRGTVSIRPAIVLEIPLIGSKTFDLPVVNAPVPDLEAAIDLGTVDVIGTAAAPSGSEKSDRKSCDEVSGGGGSSGSEGSGSGGAPSGGSSSGGTSGGSCSGGPLEILECADQTVTSAQLLADSPKSAVAVQGSCTDPQLDALEAAANAPGDAAYLSVTGACRACIFTDVGASETALPDTMASFGYVEGGVYVYNAGWCIGNRVHEPACGEAVFAYEACGPYVCQACGTVDPKTGVGDAANTACNDAAYESEAYVCKRELLPVAREACGDGRADAVAFCSQLDTLQAIRILCGP